MPFQLSNALVCTIWPRPAARLTCSLLATIIIAGCGGGKGGNDSSDHDRALIDSAGRLALYDRDNSSLRIMDLDDGSLLADFSFPGAVPGLYASPANRYAVVAQRADNLVSFVDGGLYTEDHGDHMHDYAVPPTVASFTLHGTAPTHYSPDAASAVIFNDGASGVVSSLSIVSDASILQGTEVASLTLDNNMHGVAKLIGDRLFVTRRDASITDTTLPAEVERYHLDSSSFTLEERYTDQCPRLHGADNNSRYLVFGCVDGVLVIDLESPDYVATKLENPASLTAGSRIGTVLAHHNVEGLMGIAGSQMFIIEPDTSNPYTELSLPAGVRNLARGFDAHGDVFYVMASDGNLYLYDAATWSLAATVNVSAALPESATTPAIAASASEERLFVLLPDQQQIVEVNTANGSLIQTRTLSFNASKLVWLGLPAHHH